MRKIKFRGKRLLSNDWEYGNLISRNDGGCFIETGDLRIVPLQENTIGQFTGLLDRSYYKSEIYEGDVVYAEFKDGSNCKSLVGWNEEELSFGLMDEYAYRSLLEGYKFPYFDNLVLKNFYEHALRFNIIGNIHDNPQLLEER